MEDWLLGFLMLYFAIAIYKKALEINKIENEKEVAETKKRNAVFKMFTIK